MATIQLTPDGPSFPVPHAALLQLAKEICKDSHYDPELFQALHDLNIPSVTNALQSSESDDDDFDDFDRPLFSEMKDVVSFMEGASSWDLEELAYGIGEIEDKAVLTAVTQKFLEHPDPLYRQILARNRETPLDVLNILAKGPDALTASYAQKNLANDGDDDLEYV